MAQIKNIKKPGDLIRGAKVGVAGLDKDGNVVGTGLKTSEVVHTSNTGTLGQVITMGTTGPIWSDPSTSGKYLHTMSIRNIDSADKFRILGWEINEISTAFTNETFIAYLKNISGEKIIPVTGGILLSTSAYLSPAFIFKSSGQTIAVVGFDSAGVDHVVGGTNGIDYEILSEETGFSYNDIVTPI